MSVLVCRFSQFSSCAKRCGTLLIVYATYLLTAGQSFATPPPPRLATGHLNMEGAFFPLRS